MKTIPNIVLTALLTAFLALGAMATLTIASAQAPVDYDADDDGLIEIEWLEQLNAVRWDLDGDGVVDDGGNAETYSKAFPDGAEGMGCADSCLGYELTRDLNFKSADSYVTGTMNSKWTSGDGWLPIGVDIENPYSAILEGNERTITNLFISRKEPLQPESIGLFGLNRGQIRHLKLIDVDVTGDINVGGIAGSNSGGIASCHVSGSVSGRAQAGGLVGSNGGNISSSYGNTNVLGKGHVGGLVGYSFGNITASHATGRASSEKNAGGLVGANDGGGVISSSYATGQVSGSSTNGGLVGENYGVILSSYANTSLVGGFSSGGLVGLNRGRIASSYASGNASDVSSSRESAGGGLVGHNLGDISASYAAGDISGGGIVGGIAGHNEGIIRFSYAIGSVSSEESAGGGLVGTNTEDGTVLASYWNTETSGQSIGVGEGSDIGVEGKTIAALQEPTDYTGIYAEWFTDIDNADADYDETTGVDDVWDFGTSSQYPELKADLDNSGHASWWEFGPQHGRPQPTATPTPLPTNTPTQTLTPTATSTSTITPTPTHTEVPTNTPTPTETPSPTMTPTPTETPVPTSTATDTPVLIETPVPTETPLPPTQTPVVIVVTATPSPDEQSGGGCNSVGTMSVGTAVANILLMTAPLILVGSAGLRKRKSR